MKRLIALFGLLIGLTIVSCNKQNECGLSESKVTAPANEKAALIDSLEKYGIRNAMEHPSGFFYRIVEQGSGASATDLCSSVFVKYRGTFFNGSGFDSSLDRTVSFTLGQVISGWQKAIPLVKAGGTIDIYIPPSLGYGSASIPGPDGGVLIPSYSYLVFNVELVDVQ